MSESAEPRTSDGMDSALDAALLFDALPDCYWALDAQGAVSLFNAASEAFFGLSKIEVLGKPAQGRLPAMLLEQLDGGMQRAQNGERVHMQAVSPAGPRQTLGVALSPWAGGVVVQQRDTTLESLISNLAEALREVGDPNEVLRIATATIGEALGLDRVGYGEVDPDQVHVIVHQDWTCDGMPSVVGHYELEAFGPPIIAELRAGRTIAAVDVRTDPRTMDPAYVAAFAAISTTSVLATPLHKDGRMVAMLFVHNREPFAFTPEHMLLFEAVVQQTWAAHQRAQSEDSRRKAEDRLRLTADAGRIGLFSWDLPANYIEWSPLMYELTGVDPATPGSEIYSAWLQRVHEDDRRQADERVRQAIAQGGEFELDYRIASPEGWRWILCRGEVQGRAGEPRRMLGVNLDVTERRVAVQALRASEAKLRALAEIAPTFVWYAGPEGAIHYLNGRWYEYTGQTPEQALPSGWTSAVHPDDQERTQAQWADALSRGVTYEVELRYRRHDGEYRWYLARAEPLLGPAGQIVEWFGASTDIHDRKLAEGELQQRNARLETEVEQRTRELERIWRNSRDLMLVARTDGTMLSANPAWERLLGWPVEWLEGRNAGEIKHPDDAERTLAELGRLSQGLPTIGFEDRYRHQDGSWRWISWVIEPQGDIIYCIGRDVTAEREAREAAAEAEAARRESDALYRAYFENTAEALFVISVEADGGFVIEQLNEAHQRAVGLADAAGKRLEEVLPANVVDLVSQRYRDCIAAGEVSSYRDEIEHGGQRQLWDTVLVPLRDLDGRIFKLVGSGRDVTAQISAEEALSQAQKMQALGQLSGGIAHDFNNLLGAIIGSLDLVQRRAALDERSRRYVEGAISSAERGAKLTAQLLAFARAQRMELKPVLVDGVVERSRDLLAHTLGPQVALDIRLCGQDAWVLSDPTQLELAILNLAINARDAMPDGGELTVAVAPGEVSDDPDLPSGSYVELAVRDTGHGMPPNVAARALEPFFTTKGVGKGTGLGLSQVYGVARQAGGALRIESAPGKGTTIRLLLPLKGPPAASLESTTPGQEITTDQVHVLVVDDDPDVRRVLVDGLDALGHTVREAADGKAALEALDDAFDVVILDFAMPGMNGAQVAREIWRRQPRQRIVFVSGFSDTAAIEAVAGKDALLLKKPFRVGDLQQVLARALAGSTLRARSDIRST